MPKSKRDKKISLTKTSKKGKALKTHIIDDVKSCVEKYERIFLFSVRNMRNNKLKDLRDDWADSRFFFGKNKVVALGFGTKPETEIADGIHKLSNALKGQCGWMEQYGEEDYARSGFVINETIELPAGPLSEFSHAIEPHLRSLGMPTALVKGVVTLTQDFTVCKKGQTLTPEQARILKLFGKQLATFQLIPLGYYSKKKGYIQLAADDDNNQDENEVEKMEAEDENET
ncbi:hypothetical protein HCN44_002367 [Aphidius gifuensis]|uniref:Ribosome assembly factor mrt4 n=1 Tax=Aphidius gifuensis TaxID=684658 RepID=A0A834Y577_APHGI|nr:hypothetical protein HCN44_002367 [Aphidius gifuensis]